MLKLIYLTYEKTKWPVRLPAYLKNDDSKTKDYTTKPPLCMPTCPRRQQPLFYITTKTIEQLLREKLYGGRISQWRFRGWRWRFLRQKSSAMMPGLKGCLDWSLGGSIFCAGWSARYLRWRCRIARVGSSSFFSRIFGKDACGVVFFFSVVSERGGFDCQWVFACKVWIWFKHQNLVFFGVEHHIIYR